MTVRTLGLEEDLEWTLRDMHRGGNHPEYKRWITSKAWSKKCSVCCRLERLGLVTFVKGPGRNVYASVTPRGLEWLKERGWLPKGKRRRSPK